MPRTIDDELASLAGRLRIDDGRSPASAIILDDDIDHDTPIAARSERPRVDSILRGTIGHADVQAALQSRGIARGEAAPDGNCAQRAAACSVGRCNARAAVASDAATLEALSDQRERIIDKVTGHGVALDDSGGTLSFAELRGTLNQSRMQAFRTLGHWSDTGGAFILFLFGLADDLGLPLAVLHRTRSGYADPVCVYRAQGPGEARVRRQHNRGCFEYVAFAELLRWLDAWLATNEWPPPLALVEFVPGHYSPFVHSGRPTGSG